MAAKRTALGQLESGLMGTPVARESDRGLRHKGLTLGAPSFVSFRKKWWARQDSNLRPPACEESNGSYTREYGTLQSAAKVLEGKSGRIYS